MVLGEEFNAPSPYSVDPTVPHMTDGGQSVFIVEKERRYRCAHPSQGRLLLAGFEHFAIRLLHGDTEPAPSHRAPSVRISYWGEFFFLGLLDREPHLLHSQSTGYVPADMPPHAVRHDVEGHIGKKPERILVVLAHLAPVGSCSAAD